MQCILCFVGQKLLASLWYRIGPQYVQTPTSTVQLTSWVVIGNSASKHDGNAKENVCYKTSFPCFKLLHDIVTVSQRMGKKCSQMYNAPITVLILNLFQRRHNDDLEAEHRKWGELCASAVHRHDVVRDRLWCCWQLALGVAMESVFAQAAQIGSMGTGIFHWQSKYNKRTSWNENTNKETCK